MLRSPCALNVTQENNLTRTVTRRRVELYKNEKNQAVENCSLAACLLSKSEGNFE